jgi:hypothetical protein
LVSETGSSRREIIELIRNDKSFTKTNPPIEKIFHKNILMICSQGCREILEAIIVYEEFSKLLQEAFNSMISCMQNNRICPTEQLLELEEIHSAYKIIPGLIKEINRKLVLFNEEFNFFNTYQVLDCNCDIKQWLDLLIGLHRDIQKNKPPNGKAPWFDTIGKDQFIIRPEYKYREIQKVGDYVHAYRTIRLWGFLVDLGVIKYD